MKLKLYLAGPLFTVAEREFNRTLASVIEQSLGHEVWLPQEKEPREKTAKAIFEADVKGLDWCDVVIANMDGADPDSGTCWECGYAYAAGRAVVQYRTDMRACADFTGAAYNLMLTESADAVIRIPFDEIAENIAKYICDALIEIGLGDSSGEHSGGAQR